MIKILVTDGANKNTLSILRNLDHNKFWIDIATHLPKWLTLCSYSKYCRNVIKLTYNTQDIDDYAKELIDILKKEDYDVFIPVGLNSNLMASKYKRKIQSYVHLLAPDWDVMNKAANKDMAMDLASSIGVPIPRTSVLENSQDVYDVTEFPVVIKSSDESKNYIKYCNNLQELLYNFNHLSLKSRTKIICQEYIQGFGCGFFGIYSEGKLISYFLHKRLAEFPITGGPSAVAESFYDEKLYHYGKQLCDALYWNGPIMAEFKYDVVEGDYKLIEINPKLWGSLDLTIKSGINVPDILIQLALGKKIEEVPEYAYVKFRWIFPDEWKVLMSALSWNALRNFFFQEPGVVNNISYTDPVPTLLQIARSFIEGIAVVSGLRQ